MASLVRRGELLASVLAVFALHQGLASTSGCNPLPAAGAGSGGGRASANAGGGGGDTGGGAGCGFTFGACESCGEASCCSQWLDCNASPDCVTLNDCLNACSDTACEQACDAAAGSTAVAILDAAATCLQTSCGSCGGTGGGGAGGAGAGGGGAGGAASSTAVTSSTSSTGGTGSACTNNGNTWCAALMVCVNPADPYWCRPIGPGQNGVTSSSAVDENFRREECANQPVYYYCNIAYPPEPPYPACQCAYGGSTGSPQQACQSQSMFTCYHDNTYTCCPQGKPYVLTDPNTGAAVCYADWSPACMNDPQGRCPTKCL